MPPYLQKIIRRAAKYLEIFLVDPLILYLIFSNLIVFALVSRWEPDWATPNNAVNGGGITSFLKIFEKVPKMDWQKVKLFGHVQNMCKKVAGSPPHWPKPGLILESLALDQSNRCTKTECRVPLFTVLVCCSPRQSLFSLRTSLFQVATASQWWICACPSRATTAEFAPWTTALLMATPAPALP